MHGLSDHGVAGHTGMDLSVQAPMAHHAGSTIVPLENTAAASATHAPMDMGMGLCLAILGVGLLLWLTRGPARERLTVRHATGGRSRLIPRSRSPDPPDLIQLAIQRC
jgi:hypothetical protein